MIKLFESFNEYSQVKDWLDRKGIENYTINDDLIVDVDGDVDISFYDLTEIPIQFGKVDGNFLCCGNRLTTLKGCPKYVGGGFDAFNNKLTSLEYCPEITEWRFDVHNNNLTTLRYMPKQVNGNISIYDNPLPTEILSIHIDLKSLIKHQDDYGIWDGDGSFNKGRWDILLKEYDAGII